MSQRETLEKEKYKELYRRFRELYPLPAQLIQQAINQGVETGKSFLKLKRDSRIHKPHPRFGTSPSALPKTAGATRKPSAPRLSSKSPCLSQAGGGRFGSSHTRGSGSTGGESCVKRPSWRPPS